MNDFKIVPWHGIFFKCLYGIVGEIVYYDFNL